ncbi:MAG: T9SS type A sorting domain-containing protein [Bacteroidia bacterium]
MKYKSTTLAACIMLAGAFSANAQNNFISEKANHQCGTMQNFERLKKLDPALEARMQADEQKIHQWIADNANFRTSGLTDTIPVVVHVVWKTTAQNISTAQVLNTVLALNQDYGRTGADTANTPSVWKPIAANTGIQFCLAQRDPFGAPTDGIERRQTTAGPFTTDDAIKSYATGGLNAWDVSKYFNIWIADLGGGLGGYGEFPTSFLSNTFGNVTDYMLVGLTGWVPTHECGHCFNLRHIWGDDGGACTGSDLVTDTPNQADATNSPCPSFPALDACQTASPGYMFMNYMDYGSSACKNIFTQGQATRVQAAIHNLAYASLLTSDGCVPVVLQQTDAGNPSIVSPSGQECSTTIIPIVQLRNWGTDTMVSVTINYEFDNNGIQTFAWSGNLASLAIVNVTLPSATLSAGIHTLTSYTTNPNGLPDGNAANDTTSGSFDIIPLGTPTPIVEGFEPTIFPPTGWALNNFDNSVTWVRTTKAAKTGVASAYVDSKNYPCNGCIDELITPNLDLTTLTNPVMTFQIAYRMLSDPGQFPNWSDTLEIDISTDCGDSWTQLYKKYSVNLTTIIPAFSTVDFIPGPNDWRQEIITLAPFTTNNNVLIKFIHTNDYENGMYVDDINIDNSTGVNEIINDEQFSVYPNPANSNVQIYFTETSKSKINLLLIDALGKIIKSEAFETASGGILSMNVSAVASGVYILRINKNGNVINKKLIINHFKK